MIAPVIPRVRRLVAWGALAVLAAVASGCSPALDWRDVRVQAVGLALLFPCKPQVQERSVEVAGQPWSASLLACDADGMTFAALALNPPVPADKPAPAAVDRLELLRSLIPSASVRWGPVDGEQRAPEGVTLPAGLQAQWTRHLKQTPGAPPLQTQALFLSTRQGLVQMSVHGTRLSPAALDHFFGQLKVVP